MILEAFQANDVWLFFILALIAGYRVVELRRTTDPIRKRQLKDGLLGAACAISGVAIVCLGVLALQTYVFHQIR
jgi:hypothetical protein